jgi:DNA-binding response OmpR family regulator
MGEGILNDILIVDDDQAIVELLISALREAGYQCCVAYDGESALFAIATARPALVILDLHLPGLTGLDVVAELRRYDLDHVPIILMTADPAAVTQSLSMTFRAQLLKPFTITMLLGCVARYIGPKH